MGKTLLDRTFAGQGVLARAAILDEGVAEVHARLGEALRLLGRNEEALAALEQALALAPDDAYALGTKGQVLLALGRKDEALAMLERAAGLPSELPWIHGELADPPRVEGRFEEALRQVATELARGAALRNRARRLGLHRGHRDAPRVGEVLRYALRPARQRVGAPVELLLRQGLRSHVVVRVVADRAQSAVHHLRELVPRQRRSTGVPRRRSLPVHRPADVAGRDVHRERDPRRPQQRPRVLVDVGKPSSKVSTTDGESSPRSSRSTARPGQDGRSRRSRTCSAKSAVATSRSSGLPPPTRW